MTKDCLSLEQSLQESIVKKVQITENLIQSG